MRGVVFVQYICRAVVLVLCLSGVAHAADTVTFSLFPREWPPFEMVIDGQPVGAAVGLFEALMPEDVETLVELIPSPRSRLRVPLGPVYARFESKLWIKDPESFLWSDVVMSVKTVLYSSVESPHEYENEASLHGLTIGCIKGFVYPEVQHLFDSGKATRYDVNNDLVLLRMVKAGRVDVAMFDDMSAAWILRSTDDISLNDFHIAQKPLGSAPLRFYFNKNDAWRTRLPEINSRIRRAQKDGTIDRIMDQYR